MKSVFRGAVIVAVLGAALPVLAQTTRVTGTVSYRERITLSPSAVVEVRLEDVSRAGGVPPVVADVRIERPGQVPIRFELPYDPRAIDARARYAVRATIRDGGVTIFTSLDTRLAITQGHGDTVDLVLTRVGTAPPPPPPAPPVPPLPPLPFRNLPATFAGTLPCADCEGIRYHLNLFADDSFVLRRTYLGRSGAPVDDWGSWTVSSDRRVLVLAGGDGRPVYFAIPTTGSLRQLDLEGLPIATRAPNELRRTSAFRPMDLAGAFRGAYTYLADAASFVECSTGQRWPVAGEQASRDLERMYVAERSAPGAAVIAEIEGRVTLRPRVEGPGTEPTLIVTKVSRLLPRESCAPRFAASPLTGTDWLLTSLAGKPVPAAADARRQPSLTFQSPGDDGRGAYAGSSGCNRLIGTWVTANATMTLTAAGTLMACKEEAATEAAFLAAIKATRAYRVAGQTLELLDAKGQRLARFTARVPAGITR